MECVTDHAIFSFAAQGRVAVWNARAERIVGSQKVESIGQPFSCFFA
jgi:hypothetical protein